MSDDKLATAFDMIKAIEEVALALSDEERESNVNFFVEQGMEGVKRYLALLKKVNADLPPERQTRVEKIIISADGTVTFDVYVKPDKVLPRINLRIVPSKPEEKATSNDQS